LSAGREGQRGETASDDADRSRKVTGATAHDRVFPAFPAPIISAAFLRRQET
jgi:hypothetical protein